MLAATQVVLSPLSVDDLAARLGTPTVEAVLATMPEAIRRGRLGEYLNDKQAQAETGLSARQLRHLRSERRIPYRRCGRAVLYKTSDLFGLIDAGAVPVRERILG